MEDQELPDIHQPMEHQVPQELLEVLQEQQQVPQEQQEQQEVPVILLSQELTGQLAEPVEQAEVELEVQDTNHIIAEETID